MAKTEIEIIDETVRWYQSHPRAIRKNTNGYSEGCYYFKPGEPDCMCAVGRCLTLRSEPIKKMRQAAKEGNITGFDVVSGDISELEDFLEDSKVSFEQALKPGYRGHKIDLWQSLQNLHDTEHFWEGNKLTESGEMHVKLLRDKYANKATSPERRR